MNKTEQGGNNIETPNSNFKKAEEINSEDKVMGHSLSLCVKDIMEGKIKEEQVEKIMTNVKTEDLSEAMDKYMETYWKGNEQAKELVERLISSDKVEYSKEPINVGVGNWELLEDASKKEAN